MFYNCISGVCVISPRILTGILSGGDCGCAALPPSSSIWQDISPEIGAIVNPNAGLYSGLHHRRERIGEIAPYLYHNSECNCTKLRPQFPFASAVMAAISNRYDLFCTKYSLIDYNFSVVMFFFLLSFFLSFFLSSFSMDWRWMYKVGGSRIWFLTEYFSFSLSFFFVLFMFFYWTARQRLSNWSGLMGTESNQNRRNSSRILKNKRERERERDSGLSFSSSSSSCPSSSSGSLRAALPLFQWRENDSC